MRVPVTDGINRQHDSQDSTESFIFSFPFCKTAFPFVYINSKNTLHLQQKALAHFVSG